MAVPEGTGVFGRCAEGLDPGFGVVRMTTTTCRIAGAQPTFTTWPMWTGWVGGAMRPWLGELDGAGAGLAGNVGLGLGDVGVPWVGRGFEGAVGLEIGPGAEVGFWVGFWVVVGLGAGAVGVEVCVGLDGWAGFVTGFVVGFVTGFVAGFVGVAAGRGAEVAGETGFVAARGWLGSIWLPLLRPSSELVPEVVGGVKGIVTASPCS